MGNARPEVSFSYTYEAGSLTDAYEVDWSVSGGSVRHHDARPGRRRRHTYDIHVVVTGEHGSARAAKETDTP